MELHFDRIAGVFFGEKDHTEPTERVQAVLDLFEGTSVRANFVPDIMTDLWLKYVSNVSQNLPQAILGVGFGAYKDSEHVRAVATGLWQEVVQVAAKKGVRLPKRLLLFHGTVKEARFSTLQDLDAGRHTEIDIFAGEMMRMGKEFEISVPYCEYTYHMIKALEEKNDGKFNY